MKAATRTYEQSARAAGQERTRTALLDAAEKAFFSEGWDSMTLESVAAAAGVTKQTLLRHFGSKQTLFEAAWERAYESVREQRFAAPIDDLPGAIDNLLDHYEEVGDHAMRIGAAGGTLERIGERARRVHYEWVDHAFGPALRRFRGPGRKRRRAALIALCDVHTWWLLSNDLGMDRGEVRATLIQAASGLLEEEK